jgi:spermidine/putrescine-binding protein
MERYARQVMRRLERTPLSRRGFMWASAMSATAAFLAACAGGGGGSAAPSTAPSAAPSASGASGEPAPQPSYATEGALFMYNWAEYIDLENIEEFKARYNITDWTYDIYDSNEALLTKLDGGATGLYDIASPTAEFVKVMADKGYIVELPFDRIPNAKLIPKDWGTTGIAIRKKVVTEEVKTWKQFFEVAPKYTGRIVMVESAGDVMTAPLKALGYSLNSTDPTELNAARELLRGVAPHVLALDSNDYGDKLASEEAVMGLVWTGGVVSLRDEPETADIEYIIPEDGTLFWVDTWVQLADAPHPEAGLAWLNFIQEPAIQAKETETNRYATANDEAKKLVAPEILNDPTVFVPEGLMSSLGGAQDVSTDPLRVEIWEEFSASIGG